MSESTSPPRLAFAFWAFLAWAAITLMWWALAFAPLPLPPAWLETARRVCFGTLPNGLPEPWGWASLVVSPLAMLAFLLAVWGRELRLQLRGMARSPWGRVALVALLAVPLAGASWVGRRVVQARQVEAALELSRAPEELPAGYPRVDRAAPALGLVDQSGGELDLAELSGRPVLVTFAFAHCQTVCPMVVETVRGAAEELTNLGPAVVVVSLDPWRDTPSALPDMLRRWGLEELRAAHVLSGEIPRVLEVLDAWQVPWERDPRTGDVAHPALVHVLDGQGRIAYSFNAPSVRWLVEATRRLTAGPA